MLDLTKRRRRKEREDKGSQRFMAHNICPTDYADAVLMEDGEIILERMRFGLVPHWAKGRKAEVAKKFGLTFNARCETVFQLASYRGLIHRQRCLVPVTGWHEWPDRTTPYYIHRADNGLILLGAIWNVWESHHLEDDETGSVITSLSVVTTPPGRYMGKFHDRCPLLLQGDDALTWIQPGELKDSKRWFTPDDGEYLEAYRVSTAVNQGRNKSPEVIQPIAPPVPQDGDIPVTAENFEPPDLKLF